MLLRHYAATVVLVLLTGFLFAQKPCSEEARATGKFYYDLDNAHVAILIRTDSTLLEKRYKYKIWYRLEWIAECTYSLKILRVNKRYLSDFGDPRDDPMNENIRVTVSVDQQGVIWEEIEYGEPWFGWMRELRRNKKR